MLGSYTDPDGHWRLLIGEYRPWRLRLVNLVRWLLRRPPVPYPRRGPGMRWFSMGGTAAQDLDELCEWYNRHLNATIGEAPRRPFEACRVPEAMADLVRSKDGR